VYCYDDAQSRWFLASDANEPYIVQDGAKDWMDINATQPRENHNSAIAVKVMHFSRAQAGVVVQSSSTPLSGTAGGGGGCFVSALTGGSKQ
jgi:hypothetical protein